MNTTRCHPARDTTDQPETARLPRPHAFPPLVRSTDITKLWLLRMLVRLGAAKRIYIERGRWRGWREQVLARLGVGKLDLKLDGDAENAWLVQCLSLSLVEMERRRRPVRFNARIEANLRMLGHTFSLPRTDLAVLVLACMLRHDDLLAEVADCTANSNDPVEQARKVIGSGADPVRRAIAPAGMLTRSRLLKVKSGGSLYDNLQLRRGSFRSIVSSRLRTLDALFAGTMAPAPAPTLTREDYPYLEPGFDVLVDVLKEALAQRRAGVNVLLYGPPGTGKTELTRTLAQAVATPLYDVGCIDDEGAPADAATRLANAATAQRLLTGKRALLAFDEIDAIFTDGSTFFGKPTTAARSKAWVNELLEQTRTPTFWVANTIHRMDPAFVRRFDLVMEMKAPPRAQRARMLQAHCGSMLEGARIRRMVEVEAITPAVMRRAAEIVRRTGASTGTQASLLESLIDNTLVAQGHKPIRRVCGQAPDVDYDPDLCNASLDLRALADGLAGTGMGRVYLYGPPGTGKTAFGHWLAARLEKPLLQKRVSDIQSPLVGVMEARLAQAFDEAMRDGAILQIDEVDSFLRDRRQATQNWQVSQVNEFLTQVEGYDGILIASTNLVEGTDPAAMRRFDYKVKLDYLRPAQIAAMLTALCARTDAAGTIDKVVRKRIEQRETVTPGDLAVVRRQHRIAPFATANALAAALLSEVDAKAPDSARRIGFI